MISPSGYQDPAFTGREKAALTVHVARMAAAAARRDQRSVNRLERKITRIVDGAREREAS